MPHDAFEMSSPTTTAELFLRIERDHRMPRFPNSILKRIAAIAYASPDRPNAGEPVEVPARCRNPRRHRVGVVEDGKRNSSKLRGKRIARQLAHIDALELH